MPKTCAAFGCLNVSICCLCRLVSYLKHPWSRVESLSSITKRENFGSRRYLKHIAVITRSLLKKSSTRFLASSCCALVAGGVCLSRPLRYNEDAARSCRLACDKQRTEPELHHLSSLFHLWWVSFQLLLPETSKSVTFILQSFYYAGVCVCVCVCVCVGCSHQRLYWMSHSHYRRVAHLQKNTFELQSVSFYKSLQP